MIIGGVFFLIGVMSEMKIMFINNNPKPDIFWQDILPLVFPKVEPMFCTKENWRETAESHSLKLAIYFSANVDHTLEAIATTIADINIPLLCVIDDYSTEEYHAIVQKKVQGLTKTSTTSLKEIKEIINLILDGGYFLQAPKREQQPHYS